MSMEILAALVHDAVASRGGESRATQAPRPPGSHRAKIQAEQSPRRGCRFCRYDGPGEHALFFNGLRRAGVPGWRRAVDDDVQEQQMEYLASFFAASWRHTRCQLADHPLKLGLLLGMSGPCGESAAG